MTKVSQRWFDEGGNREGTRKDAGKIDTPLAVLAARRAHLEIPSKRDSFFPYHLIVLVEQYVLTKLQREHIREYDQRRPTAFTPADPLNLSHFTNFMYVYS